MASHRITLMAHVRIIPSKPALILEGRKKSIIVADIHLGFENSMIANNIFIGKNSATDELILELTDIIDAEKPDSVILLGDIKSSIKRITSNEWNEIPKFFKKLNSKCEIILVPGNHDANIEKLIPKQVSMISAKGMIEENILLTHGHTMPSKNFAHVDKIIMGHIHPVFFDKDSIINGQRVWVSIKTEKKDIFPDRTGEIEIIVIPSFNKYFYATDRKNYKKSISPIIEKIKTISSAKIVTLEGTIIGDEKIINQVI